MNSFRDYPDTALLPQASGLDGWREVGQILVDQGRINEGQLRQALELQSRQTGRLGELLCQLGYVDGISLREALVRQAGLATISLEDQSPDPQALADVPTEIAFKHKILPVSVSDGVLTLAMADPFDHGTCETVRLLSGKSIRRVYCPETELTPALRRFYGSNVARMIADLDDPAAHGGLEQESAAHLQEMAREPSVVNLVNLIILEAVDARASDIHLEPYERILKVKYRIDGLLQEMSPPPKRLEPAIVSRIKIMAGMNIAERFVPQDGHIAFQKPGTKVDIRVGTMPTIHGESVAMRLLDRSAGLLELEALGMDPAELPTLEKLLRKPHGIFLVTGPTGSGKTTTLYAGLRRIASPDRKTITIEDPVEYHIDGINQIAVNRKRGIDFAGGLRAILRQDPDIIMVGEIRDRETADIAIRSALTGHMVFSTLHTNDAAGAVTRLLDMGVEPFLLASSLEAALAQRLVRKTCQACRKPYEPDPLFLSRMGEQIGSGAVFYRGEGCVQCRRTGYSGRTGIFELLVVTERQRQVILRRGSAAEIEAVAPPGHRTMRQDGLRRALTGITTLEEVLRVTQDIEMDGADDKA